MTGKFDSFVIFAAMRTGSNLLEAHLNTFGDIQCYGEAFNPFFIGDSETDHMFGFTLSKREADPKGFLAAMRAQEGHVSGFRFFQDHDPRVLDLVMDDPRCAKIILTRNPLESFVSWKIAEQTGQWRLTDMKDHVAGRAYFSPQEFEVYLNDLQQYQLMLLHRMQSSGQTAFYLAYEDISDLDVINGLGAFIGSQEKLEDLPKKLKKQNPSPLSDKVINFEEMQEALSKLDRFDLTRTPNFEPRRGAQVPTYVAAAKSPVFYMPIFGGPEQVAKNWLADLDGVGEDALQSGFNRKSLRQWRRKNQFHRSFTIVTHPLERAWNVYCHNLVAAGDGEYNTMKKHIGKLYKVPFPAPDADAKAFRDGFLEFLYFLKGNLTGQTSVRVDRSWASQDNVLMGMARFAQPDMILRAESLEQGLAQLSEQVGIDSAPLRPGDSSFPALADIYDAELEAAAKDAYQRDYVVFGYRAWA